MPEAPPPPAFTGPERRRNRPAEVRLTDATIDYLEKKMQAAVAEGIKSAMTEETAKAFWAAGLTVLQKQATAHTGRFVVGGLWGLVSGLGKFLVLGGVVYAVGGWSALAALFKAVFLEVR